MNSGSPCLIDPLSSLDSAWKRGLWRAFGPVVSRLLRFDAINQRYRESLALQRGGGNYFENCLSVLGVRFEISNEDLERIPRTGPLVTVSNHPYGGLDGVVLGAMLSQRRDDYKLLVNHLLYRIEPMQPYLIPVDVFGGKDAAKSNLGPMRACLSLLKSGGALGLFPSGTVSHFHLRNRQVTDPIWVPHLASIIRKGKAQVVPIYFEGCNSTFFQLAGLLHPLLRTAFLGRVLVEPRHTTIRVRVGNPISAARLERFDNNESMMGFLRLKTYILQNREVAEKTSFFSGLRRKRSATTNAHSPIAAQIEPALLQREVDSLDSKQVLIEHGEYRVCYARAVQIPNLLQEIGRQREITFRAVGEGTGQPFDIDRFDQTYVHLFMWNQVKSELVGAYRLGLTDEIMSAEGRQGLYTTTLFHYKPGVLSRLSPAIELGRSFIVAEYQRKHASLGLIWRGIGQFVSRFPKYRILFGPVSISNDYQSLSKNLIVMYLREHTLDPDLSDQVKGRKPPRSRYFGRLDRTSFFSSVRDIEDVSALISEIEREEKGVPVLLKQYLKLNATMLSFNVDPEFSDCIDGLVLVDLVKTNEKTLRRYMGDEGAERFYAYHESRKTERLETAKSDD